jgi:hypothetical protein
VHLVDALGKVLHVAKNNGTKVRGNRLRETVATEKDQWVAYAYWDNSDKLLITSFTTTWTVPDVPATDNGQSIYLFNSIEPTNGGGIIQPVLQWGPSKAGGGSYWAVVSWYITGNQAYSTAPVPVSPGDSLKGIIALTGGSSDVGYDYATSFSDIPYTTLIVTGSIELIWVAEVVESYSVTSSSDYPAGSTVFSSINIETSTGTPSMMWTAVSDTDDEITTTIDVDGATDAEITITYPT